jgi:hypothetical protein
MRKVAFSALVFFACFACYQASTGNAVGTPGGDRGMVRPLFGGDSQCVVLGGSGYVPSACSGDDGRPIEGAVSAGQVVPAGDLGGKGHGPVLSMEEVGQLWVQAGGDPAHLAAAVATAESGRRPLAVNGSNGDGSIDRGLFQMNSIHGGCSTFDLAENVRCAVQLRGSPTGWNHWVAYKSGAYRRYL